LCLCNKALVVPIDRVAAFCCKDHDCVYNCIGIP
jgi:hypothetical protein